VGRGGSYPTVFYIGLENKEINMDEYFILLDTAYNTVFTEVQLNAFMEGLNRTSAPEIITSYTKVP
jgi:hypothetical protein